MSRTKKNIIALAAAVVLLGGLAGVYLWQNARQASEAAALTPTPTPVLSVGLIKNGYDVSHGKTEGEEALEIESIALANGTETLTLKPVRTPDESDPAQTVTTWVLDEYPDMVLDQGTAGDIADSLANLNASSTVTEQVDDASGFGFSPGAAAAATYSDGSVRTVRIGMETPAKDRYYLMMEGDSSLYLVQTYIGERFLNGLNDLIDKTVLIGEAQTFEYMLIAERDKPALEFAFQGTDAEKQELYDQYGTIYMTMVRPYPDREMYYTNFQDNVLAHFATFTLGDLADAAPADLSVYGLAEPSLELRFTSPSSDTHLLFGDVTEDGAQIYCMIAGRPQVFTALYEPVKIMYNLDVLKFIDRFIALLNIEDCERLQLEVPGDAEHSYDMVLEHITLPPEEGEEEETKIINPYVNGQLVQELAFKTLYRYIIGLSYDSDIGSFEPEGDPAFTLTFTMREEGPIVIRFYPYDNNFYVVQYNDDPIRYVTNKQATENVFDSVPELLAGNMDRDS